MTTRSIMVNLAANPAPLVAGYRTAGTATARFGTQTAGMQAKMAGAQTQMGNTAGAASGLTKGLIGAGSLAYAAKAVTDAAIGWESAFAGVTKTVEGTPEQMQAINDGLRTMSTEIPTSAEELAGIAESAGQLGIETDSVLDFTRVIADLGETTDLTGEQGATALARFANVTGMAQDDFDRLASVIVDLGNNMATTESEIVEFAQRLAGAGTQIGLSEGEILAFSASLSSVGVNAEAGGTAFSKLWLDMLTKVESGSDELQGFAEIAGMTSEQFATAFREDAAGAINAFLGGLGEMEESGDSAAVALGELGITEQRMRDALLLSSSASDLVSDALDRQGEAWEDNTAAQEEAAKRYDTTEAKLQIAKNAAHELTTELGEGLLPVLAEGATAAADFAGQLSEIGSWTPPDWLPGDQNFDLFDLQGAGIGGFLDGLVADWTVGGITGGVAGAAGAIGQGVFGPDITPAGASHEPAIANRAAAMRDLSAATAEYNAVAAESSETRAANRAQALADATSGAAGEFDVLTREIEINRESVDGLVTSWSDAVRELRGLTDAEIGWEQSLDDATAGVKEHGETLDLDTDAGRTNMRNLLDLRDAAIRHAEAVYEDTGSVAEANAVLDDHQEALYEAGRQAGWSEEKARNFAGELDDIPNATDTFVHLYDGEASDRADGWQEKLRGIPDHIYTTAHVNFAYSGFVDSSFEARKALRQTHAGGWAGSGPEHSGPQLADEVPTMLQAGEFVVNRDAASQHAGLLQAINDGTPIPVAAGSSTSTTDNSDNSQTIHLHTTPDDVDMFKITDALRRTP